MKVASPDLIPDVSAAPEDLIKEARGRQRRRWFAAGVAGVAGAAAQSAKFARSSDDDGGAASGRYDTADPAQHRHLRAVVASQLRPVLRGCGS